MVDTKGGGTAESWLRRWGARPTGERWRTPSSRLAVGVRDGVPVIAKVAVIEEERRGGRLLAWWSAHDGLPVLEQQDDAVLMRRAIGPRDLADWSVSGRDDDAVDALVDTVAALHAIPAPPASVGLMPLTVWFRDLVERPQVDPLLDRAASCARDLLAEPSRAVALHGDVHRGNVLDLDGARWVAIDPKALLGAAEFDLANLVCNPTEEMAVARLDARLARIADPAPHDGSPKRSRPDSPIPRVDVSAIR